MNKVYVLYCQVWSGNSYSTEIICAYADEELAHRTALSLQQDRNISDDLLCYRVEKVEFDNFIP